MNTLTGHKDTDMLVLSQLDDRDLMNFCLSGTHARRICDDEVFWRNRTFQKYGQVNKPANKTWKEYYLNKVLLQGQQLDQALYDAARLNNVQEVMRLIDMGAELQYGLDGALFGNNEEMVNFIRNLM